MIRSFIHSFILSFIHQPSPTPPPPPPTPTVLNMTVSRAPTHPHRISRHDLNISKTTFATQSPEHDTEPPSGVLTFMGNDTQNI